MPAVPDSPSSAAPTLLLASRSPRRALLLREAGFEFRQITPPFDDPADPNPPEVSEPDADSTAGDAGGDSGGDSGGGGPATAQRLAERKARSFSADDMSPFPAAVLLAADTLGVTAAGRLIGTPETRPEAHAMLAALIGQTHTIVTGVALRHPDGRIQTFADTAEVHLGHVNEDQLSRYLDSDQWVGKAGGYNLIERQHAGWPITVTGDPATVMGLPMRRLGAVLGQWGVLPGGRE